MLKTENSSQLFDVTLFCRNGHPKRKVEKSECKNENGSNPNPEFSFFTLMGGYLFCQCFPKPPKERLLLRFSYVYNDYGKGDVHR